jgi:thioredoxin-related protein
MMNDSTNKDESLDPRSKRMRVLLPCLLVISISINVLLAQKVKDLKNRIVFIKTEQSLTIGSVVPSIQAKDISGRAVSITYSGNGKPTILYIFKPECSWCTRNLQNVKALAKEVDKDFNFVGLSLVSDKLRDYIALHKVGFPVYTELPSDVIAAYKFGGTPQTIVVSPEGKILKNWAGAYSGSVQEEIEQYFSIKMPGLITTNECQECGNK